VYCRHALERHSVCHYYSPTNISTTPTASMVLTTDRQTDRTSCDCQSLTEIQTVWKCIWIFRVTYAMTRKIISQLWNARSECWLTGWSDARTMALGDAERTKPPHTPTHTHTHTYIHTHTHTKLPTCSGQNASPAVYAPNGNFKPTGIPASQNCRMGFWIAKRTDQRRGRALKGVPKCSDHRTVGKAFSRGVRGSSAT
jgi:hypothetical protein